MKAEHFGFLNCHHAESASIGGRVDLATPAASKQLVYGTFHITFPAPSDATMPGTSADVNVPKTSRGFAFKSQKVKALPVAVPVGYIASRH